MKYTITASAIMLLSMFMLLQPVFAETQPEAWMEPENPTDEDTIRFYCRAPGAYEVKFNICSDDGSICYLQTNHGKTDSETWWVEVDPMKVGTKAHYEVTIVYQNDTTGNESEVNIGPYHFEVDASLRPETDDTTPSPAVALIILTVAISATIWGKIKRD